MAPAETPRLGTGAQPPIQLVSPANGVSLGPDDPPLVVVEGRVADPQVTSVTLLANETRIAVPVVEGRFRHVLPVLEPSVRLVAEAGPRQASDVVTVHSATAGVPTGVLVVRWPAGLATGEVEVVASHRGSPGRTDLPARAVTLRSLPGEGPPEAYYVRNLQPGAVTLWLRPKAPLAAPVAAVLYLSDGKTVLTRPLPPLAVAQARRHALARVLVPQGVLWEHDDWFTGKSEDAESITKFRFPDGIRWTERKADLR